MKLGIVTTFNARCGIATYSNFLGEELQKQGLDILILAEKKEALPDSFDPNFKSELKHIECWNRNKIFDELLEVVKRENITIVHIQHQFGLFPNELTFGDLLSNLKKQNVKVIITMHDIIPKDYSAINYFKVIDYADKIIVHTKSCQNLILNSWGFSPYKVVLIPHGTKIIQTPPKESSRTLLKIPKNAKLVLSWGFIWESKGLLELVEIVAEIRKKYPEAMLVHAGGLHALFKRSDYLKKILQKAMSLKFSPETFKVTGFLNEDQILLWFGACDLIVLNYARGSASASGAGHRASGALRPIIGTDDSCLDMPRYIVNRFDKVGLYKGILKVLEDKNLQRDLISQIEAYAIETSWEEIAKQHKKIFE